MIPLGSSGVPASRGEFEKALREGCAIFHSPKLRVEVAGEFPNLERVILDLSGGTLPSSLPPVRDGGTQQTALNIRVLEVTARPLIFEGGQFQAHLRADDVRVLLLGGNGGASLDLAGARSGEFTLEVSRAELEKIICAVAQSAARGQGVTIQRTKLDLRSTGPRSVEFSADVLAQKMFMQTAVKLSGALAVDDQLNARLSDLDCSGGGIIGSLACNFLKPYLTKLDGQIFPLASFALGNVRVREVTLDAGEPLRVQASFGE